MGSYSPLPNFVLRRHSACLASLARTWSRPPRPRSLRLPPAPQRPLHGWKQPGGDETDNDPSVPTADVPTVPVVPRLYSKPLVRCGLSPSIGWDTGQFACVPDVPEASGPVLLAQCGRRLLLQAHAPSPQARLFRSVVDLQVAINRFVAETNADPKLFVWTADPNRVLAAVKRGKQTLESLH